MTPDFPAAHSMDTWWFAVDADGHVAMFDSGEPGVVAVDAASPHEKLESGSDLGTALLEVLPATRPIYTMPRHPSHHARAWQTEGQVVLTFVAGEAEEALLLEQPGAQRVTSDMGIGIRLPIGRSDLYPRLHSDGGCVSCRILAEPDRGQNDRILYSTSRVGLFHFENEEYSYPTPPYLRFSSPDRPVRINELPDALARRIASVRLRGCFADAPEIQPAEHVLCEGWGVARLDLSRRHVVPMTRGQYGELYSPGEYAHYIALAADELRARGLTWDEPTVPDPGPPDPRRMPTQAPRPRSLFDRLLRWLAR